MTGAVQTVTPCVATSLKPQASSTKLIEQQAASFKPRAASIKLQAASGKLSNIFSFIKFPVSSSERLYQDKCIFRVLNMPPNLVCTQPNRITPTHFKLNGKKLLILGVSNKIR